MNENSEIIWIPATIFETTLKIQLINQGIKLWTSWPYVVKSWKFQCFFGTIQYGSSKTKIWPNKIHTVSFFNLFETFTIFFTLKRLWWFMGASLSQFSHFWFLKYIFVSFLKKNVIPTLLPRITIHQNKNESEFILRSRVCDSIPSICQELTMHWQSIG